VNLRRFVLTAAAATLATAAIAPAAHAGTTVDFVVKQGEWATVDVDSTLPHTRYDVVRNSALVGSSTTGELTVAALVAKDVVMLYNGNTLVATILYDGLPAIGEDACTGHTSFAVQRSPNAEITAAGADADHYLDDDTATWTADENAVVSLSHPLASNEVAYVATFAIDGATSIYSARIKPMQLCYEKPVRQPPVDTSPPTQTQPPVVQPELTPSAAQVTQAVKGSLSATGSSLRTRTTRRLARANAVALPFAFPEPGRVELQLVAKGQVIGTGTKTSSVNGKVLMSVQLTPAGRTLLKRSKKLKVTVKGAFTPGRTGAETARASRSVTLKR
jgi:hypothetical protein